MNSHDIWTQEAKQLIIQSKQLREQSARLCAEYEMLVSGNGIAPSSLPLRKANR